MDLDAYRPNWPEEEPVRQSSWLVIVQAAWTLLAAEGYMLIFSISVITFPAGVAALFGVVRHVIRGQHDSTRALYWRLFRENFKQASTAGWIAILLGAGVLWDMRDVSVHGALAISTWILGAVILCWTVTLFSLMVHISMASWRLMFSAFKLVFFKVHWTVVNLAVIIILWEIALRSLLFTLCIFPPLVALISYTCFSKKVSGLPVAPPPGGV